MKTIITTLSLLALFLGFLGCDSATVLNVDDSPTVVEYDFLNEANWSLLFYTVNWGSMLNQIKLEDENSLIAQNVVPENAALFGIDGIISGDTLGDFDSIEVIYNSNQNLKMVCATSDDNDGWESISGIKLEKSINEEYTNFVIYPDQFTKTWGSTSVSISACDIIAFSNENVDIIEEGDSINIEIKDVTVYTMQ